MEYGCVAITGKSLLDNGKEKNESSILRRIFKYAYIWEIHPMTFEDLLKLLDEYPDAFVMIDSKQYSVRNYQRTLEDYAQYREISIKAGIEHTLKQIIPEIYNSAMYPGTALLYKFPAYIYSLWQEYTTEELNDIAEFCQTN